MIFNQLFSEIFWFLAKRKLKKVRLVVFDLDGVMTDGNIYINENGEQTKRFNVKDGLGIKLLQRFKIEIAIISGGKGGVAKHRAKDLCINNFFFEVKDKKNCLNKLQKKLKLDKNQTIYVGDDLNDLTVKNNVSLLVGTRDANIQFKKKCDLILNNEGGGNAVREIAERLLKDKFSYKFLLAKGFTETN